MSRSQDVQPRKAASVLLLREREGGLQINLVCRHRKASFMSSSYVFPGGIAEAEENDLRLTAGRELFEEAGVLLTSVKTSPEQRERLRASLNAEGGARSQILAQTPIATESLQYYSQWITPSVESRRYHATFYLAMMPQGQESSPDHREIVDQIWVTPKEALERSAELALPPPQLRTCYELLESALHGADAVMDFARKREQHAHPLLPRACPSETSLTLLLPWDPAYERVGTGDSLPMPAAHPLAGGPSRFVLQEEGGWVHL